MTNYKTTCNLRQFWGTYTLNNKHWICGDPTFQLFFEDATRYVPPHDGEHTSSLQRKKDILTYNKHWICSDPTFQLFFEDVTRYVQPHDGEHTSSLQWKKERKKDNINI